MQRTTTTIHRLRRLTALVLSASVMATFVPVLAADEPLLLLHTGGLQGRRGYAWLAR